MNLDIKAPTERIRNILDLVQPVKFITNRQYFDTIKSVLSDSIKVILIDDG